MTIQDTGPPAQNALQTATETARDLGWLLACVTTYPADHELPSEAAKRASLRATSGPLVMHVLQDGLAVQSQPVDLADREASRFHEHVFAAGITRVRVEQGISADHLLRFAAGLVRARTAANSQGVARINVFEFVPSSIWVTLDPRIASGSDTGNSRRDLEQTLDLWARTLSAGVDALLAIGGPSDNLVELIQTTHDGIPSLDDPVAMAFMSRALEQAINAVTESVGEENVDASAESGNAATAPPEVPADALEAQGSSDANEVQVEATERHGEPSDPAELDERKEDGFHFSVRELREFTETLRRSTTPLNTQLRSTALAETLSIILHLSQGRSSERTLEGFQAKLRQATSEAAWGPRELEMLEGGVGALFDLCDAELIDNALPPLLESLHADGAHHLPDVLSMLGRTARHSRAEKLLWPHVVNQILLGIRPSEETPSGLWADTDLAPLVHACDPSRDRDPMWRLSTLEAIREQRITESILRLEEPVVYPVLAAMIESEGGDDLAEKLLDGLQRRKLDWDGAMALQNLTSCSPKVRDLLLGMLSTDGNFGASQSVGELAAAVIAESVRALSESRREEPWVAKTLYLLGRLDPSDADGLLHDVIKERKAIRFAWPKNCRDAAQQIMQDSGGDS